MKGVKVYTLVHEVAGVRGYKNARHEISKSGILIIKHIDTGEILAHYNSTIWASAEVFEEKGEK